MRPDEGRRGPALIVMARTPRLGEGKTRLRTVLSDQERLRLQEAFLRDALEVAQEAHLGSVHLAYTPTDAASWAEGEFGGRISPFPQQGEGLGARMLAALRHVEAKGFAPLIMIGTDAPLLQPRHLREALSALANVDLCLGPSADGGYYLLACREATPMLFEGVPWGTNGVLEATLRLAAESGLRYSLLETLYDVDTPDDLRHLRGDLALLMDEPDFRAPGHTAKVLLR